MFLFYMYVKILYLQADDSLKARNSNSYRPKRKLGNQKSSQIRYNNKESQTPTVGANGVEWATESSYNRFKKPKLTGKTSLREGGPSLSEMEPKRKNIVSSITSFIPLVQQKQAAAALPGNPENCHFQYKWLLCQVRFEY